MEEQIISLLQECFLTLRQINIKILKSDKDLVTNADISLGTLIQEKVLSSNYPLKIFTEEFPSGKSNSENPEYFIFVDELDGTDNAYRDLETLPSATLIQIAKPSKPNINEITFSDFIAVGAVIHSHGDIYTAIKDKGLKKYHSTFSNKNADIIFTEQKIEPKHSSQEVAIIDLYSMMNDPEILKTITQTVVAKDFGSSAASYCFIASGLFEAYVSSHKKGHELPLLYLLCKEANLAGNNLTCDKLINKLKKFAIN